VNDAHTTDLPMILSLKKLTVSRSLSQETMAYTADVFLDGVTVGHVRNSGNGGMSLLHVHPVHRPAVAAFEAELRALPARLDDGLDLQDRCIEDAIDTLAAQMDLVRGVRSNIKRYTKTGTLFITAEGEVMQSAGQGKPLEEALVAKYPGATIINGMPIDEAVAYCTPFM